MPAAAQPAEAGHPDLDLQRRREGAGVEWRHETRASKGHRLPNGQGRAEQGRAEQSRAEQSRAEQSRAEQSRAEQSRAEQSRAEQSRAEQSRAEQSRAEQSREHGMYRQQLLVRRQWWHLPWEGSSCGSGTAWPSSRTARLRCSLTESPFRCSPSVGRQDRAGQGRAGQGKGRVGKRWDKLSLSSPFSPTMHSTAGCWQQRPAGPPAQAQPGPTLRSFENSRRLPVPNISCSCAIVSCMRGNAWQQQQAVELSGRSGQPVAGCWRQGAGAHHTSARACTHLRLAPACRLRQLLAELGDAEVDDLELQQR